MLLLLVPLIFSLLSSVSAIGARGPSPITLHFEGARSSHSHPLASSPPISLWCAPDNNAVPINNATLIRQSDKRRMPIVISQNKKNASFDISHPSITDAGEYICQLETQYGKATHKINVYARPVAHPHTTESYSLQDNKEYHLEAPALAVAFGDGVNLSCPVLGHPQPAVKWTKDGQALALSDVLELDGNFVRISKIANEHAGVYTCTAINEYTANGKTSKPMLIIDKMLKVKSELAWVWPLLTIIAILVLLVLIIVLCEFRRKRMEKNRSSQYEACRNQYEVQE